MWLQRAAVRHMRERCVPMRGGLGRRLNLAAWGRHGRLGPRLPLVVVMQASERPLKKRLAHTLASEPEISSPAKFAPNQSQWSSIGPNCVSWILQTAAICFKRLENWFMLLRRQFSRRGCRAGLHSSGDCRRCCVCGSAVNCWFVETRHDKREIHLKTSLAKCRACRS